MELGHTEEADAPAPPPHDHIEAVLALEVEVPEVLRQERLRVCSRRKK